MELEKQDQGLEPQMKQKHTVDGRNPAPVEMYKALKIMG